MLAIEKKERKRRNICCRPDSPTSGGSPTHEDLHGNICEGFWGVHLSEPEKKKIKQTEKGRKNSGNSTSSNSLALSQHVAPPPPPRPPAPQIPHPHPNRTGLTSTEFSSTILQLPKLSVRNSCHVSQTEGWPLPVMARRDNGVGE